MEASFAYESCLGPCSQSGSYLSGVKSHGHTPYLSSFLSNLEFVALWEGKAKVYVGATPEVSWGKQMERTGYDSSSLWKPPDS